MLTNWLQAEWKENTVLTGGFRMLNHRSVLFLAFILAAAVLPAQQPQQNTATPAPTIRVTTHMVLVDVVVTDKQGNPVSGLKPEDFVVEEAGKAQKVTSLTTPTETAAKPGPELGPGIYSNKPEYRTPGGPITVMLLDALNTPFADQGYARRQMLAFVQQQFKPTDRMAVFALTGPLVALQDLTSDPTVLYAALQRYKPQAQTFVAAGQPATSASVSPTASAVVNSLDASAQPVRDNSASVTARGGVASTTFSNIQAALQEFEGAQIAYAKDQRAVLTLDALQSLARILGGLPGRKNLIWVTGELPFSFIPEDRVMTEAELGEELPSMETRRVGEHAAGNYAATFRSSHAEEIREVSSRLASAQVAVYPVDARGLSISTDIDSQETMREMARETGGRAYVNQNEIRVGVERAFEDERAAYTLGYYPENKKFDGKYRSLKVKVKRDGVEVHSRRGYYAIDPTQVKGYNPQQEVAAALGDIVPSTLVTFSAQVKPPSANSAPGKIGVTYLVDPNTLSAEDVSGGKRLNVLFYATIFSNGKIAANVSQKVDHTFDLNTYQQVLQKGLMLHLDLDPQPGQLRLAVQDARTGLVGTINAAVP